MFKRKLLNDLDCFGHGILTIPRKQILLDEEVMFFFVLYFWVFSSSSVVLFLLETLNQSLC